MNSITPADPKWVLEEIHANWMKDAQRHLLKADGWHEVRVPKDKMIAVLPRAMSIWLVNNCEGVYRSIQCWVLFELESDALAFRLTWT